jgi:hypothetical protein
MRKSSSITFVDMPMTADACACTEMPSLHAMGGGRSTPVVPAHPRRRLEDRQFAAMELAYARTGGLLSADTVARLLRVGDVQPLSTLARWIVNRRVVSVQWQTQLLMPMFQFDLPGMHPRALVLDILGELTPFLDDWALARWFAEPHLRLEGRVPVDALSADPQAVHRAACADAHARLSPGG